MYIYIYIYIYVCVCVCAIIIIIETNQALILKLAKGTRQKICGYPFSNKKQQLPLNQYKIITLPTSDLVVR